MSSSNLSTSPIPATNSPASILCPVCGGENTCDAVFCANPACHKALGDFKYVLEELKAEARWHEVLAEKITNFIGRPHFVAVHIFWFTLWVAVNTGIIAIVRRFDEYPFGLLSLILAAEAVLMVSFVLITENRQNVHADKRAELDYEVNVRTYREINEIGRILDTILERLDKVEAALKDQD